MWLKWLSLGLYLVCIGMCVWSITRTFARATVRHERAYWLFMVITAATWSCSLYALVAAPPRVMPMAVGCVLQALSIALFVWSARTIANRGFEVVFTRAATGRLTTDGPYRWTRHPFYVSYVMFNLGAALCTGEVAVLVCVVLLYCIYCAAAADEEARIAATSNAFLYELYARRVGTLFPTRFSRPMALLLGR